MDRGACPGARLAPEADVRAFLLAGGLGERLRPLTDQRPKCLVTVQGVPLLEHWLRKCRAEGIESVLVNVSRFPEQVVEYIGRRRKPPHVEVVVEEHPLGSAATVRGQRAFVEGEESFWILYSDTLINASLAPLLSRHRSHAGVLTMGLFSAPDPTAVGVVELDNAGWIRVLEEKPAHPRGSLANAGVYLARQSLFDAIPEPSGREPLDFGRHVLPALVGRMSGVVLAGEVLDVGTPDALRRANEQWPAQPDA
jgi:mannose-1-phosphate guanylyltransferase